MAYPTDGLLIWEVNDSGNADDTNGGAYYADGTGGSVDKSQGAAIVRNDLVIGATTTEVTSAGTPFTSSDVNNLINITGGVSFTTGRRRIVSVAAGVATLSSSAGTAGSTGGTSRLGGPMRTIGLCAAAAAAISATNGLVWVTGVQTITSNTSNIAGGRAVFPADFVVRGYHAVRGDNVLSSTMLPHINRTIENVASSTIDSSGKSSTLSNLRLEQAGGGWSMYLGSVGNIRNCWISGGYECYLPAACIDNTVVICPAGKIITSVGSVVANSYFSSSAKLELVGGFSNCTLVAVAGFDLAGISNVAQFSGCTLVSAGTLFSPADGKSLSFSRCLLYSTNSVGTVAGNSIFTNKCSLLECAYNVAPTNCFNMGGNLYTGDPFVNRASGDYRLTDALYSALSATATMPGLSATTFPRTIGAVPATASGGAPMIGSRIGKAA